MRFLNRMENKKMKNDQGKAADDFIDSEIISLLKGRDPVYLKTLFLEVNPFLMRVCISNSIYDENAHDVIHQTWETFFTNLEKFEGRSQIRTFICGILFNKIREHRRQQGKTHYEEDSERVMSHAFTVDGWWSVIPHSPERIIELRQSSDLIQECLEGLSEQQKTAFIMKEVDEENSEKICNIMGVNVTHLRVLLFRAKDKLRKCLEGHTETEPI
jgi:RNA polymerase sigma factor (sigma-70 family)